MTATACPQTGDVCWYTAYNSNRGVVAGRICADCGSPEIVHRRTNRCQRCFIAALQGNPYACRVHHNALGPPGIAAPQPPTLADIVHHLQLIRTEIEQLRAELQALRTSMETRTIVGSVNGKGKGKTEQ